MPAKKKLRNFLLFFVKLVKFSLI